MRWSLQRQLLLPMVAVLVLAIGLTSLASAFRGIDAARRNQFEQLRRAAGTLATATFPLTRPVLESMRSLTGAEYIVLSAENGVVSATLEPPPAVLAVLRTQPETAQLSDLSRQP